MGEHERRIAIYRFSPANMGYGRGYLEIPDDKLESFTPQQRAVLEPPYANRLDRTVLKADGTTKVVGRSSFKKDFDEQVFKTKYF